MLAALAMSALSSVPAHQNRRVLVVDETTRATSPADRSTSPADRSTQQAPSDTKTARLDAWRRRGIKAPTGKRNSWSVKQGQRRATKARNQARHRQAVRG